MCVSSIFSSIWKKSERGLNEGHYPISSEVIDQDLILDIFAIAPHEGASS